VLDDLVNRFRLASRDLFNQYYHVDNPYQNDGRAAHSRFDDVEELLFQTLVVEPGKLSVVEYGQVHPQIRVELRHGDRVPVMLNRGEDSGYWDYPIHEVTREPTLLFVRFFDWDQLDFHDNRYVRVQVGAWKSHPEVAGRHALIESQYVRFTEA